MINSVSFNEIEKILRKRDNYKEIKRAYEYAEKEHAGMKRLTGDDFMVHIIETLKILLDLNVDDVTLIGACLHEIITNGNKTVLDIKRDFGEEVSIIVDSITKINRLELTDNNESSIIYLRKVLVGLAIDVRVLFIKLACRLHNMRTNWVIKAENQKVKAEETMKVLVPIAHRLGMYSIKGELENLSLFYLKPTVYKDIEDKLNTKVREKELQKMKDALCKMMDESGIKYSIKGRVKSVYSLYNKLNKGKSWDNIYDILALRILVNKELECYQVMNLIHQQFVPFPNRYKDYIANPKANMYQSLHTTVYGIDNKIFEIQVRTHDMDEIAERGVASHWSYKEKGNKKYQDIMEQKLEMFRNVIDASNNESDNDFASNVNSDIFSDVIYVYTPKGDTVELPLGATPIDFAYRIHSHVGDTLVSAIVNDQIVPLTYELKNNDIVNIKTNPNGKPNKDWLNIVKTPQAKNKIKSYFSKKDREEYINKGKEILEAELRKRKLAFSEVLTNDSIEKILKDLKLKDLEEIYLGIGSLRFTAGYIIKLTTTEKSQVNDLLIDRSVRKQNHNYKSSILVDGVNDIMVNIAKCCMPIKGDKIVGYITKGQGINVHKADCPNVLNSKDRLIEVSWNEDNDNSFYYTNVLVKMKNNTSDIANVITEIGKKDSSVFETNSRYINSELVYELNIKVKDKNHLEEIKRSIRKLDSVKEVL